MTRSWSQMLRDDRASAVIELALVAPVLALMTIGVVDMSNAFGRKLQLEQGAQRAIEKIMQTTGDYTVEDTIKLEAVCQVNGTKSDGTCKSGNIDADDVTVSYRLECNGTKVDDYETECPSGQKEARYISVKVEGTYEPMFPIKFKGIGTGTAYKVEAVAGVRIS